MNQRKLVGPQNDLTGQRFGKLVAIKPESSNQYGYYWLCKCDCGEVTIARAARLRAGDALSCGCQQGPAKTKRTKATKPKPEKIPWGPGHIINWKEYFNAYSID